MRAVLSAGLALVLTAAAQAPPPSTNHSVDPEHLLVAKAVPSAVTVFFDRRMGSSHGRSGSGLLDDPREAVRSRRACWRTAAIWGEESQARTRL